jgi:NAD(P)-dependent dehydrogenase (short-subunit alcohol dehydrogenase family)
LVAAYEVDMTDEASVEGFFDRIDSVDHLFIPAAELPGGNVRTTDATSLRPAIDSRFWGSFYATKYAIPRLAQSGSITYCSGISTVKAFPGEAVVAASCAAVESLARTLAVELAPIRVNTICPGVIDTSLLAKYWGDRLEEVRETFAQTLPVKRLGRPEDVAHAVVFLMENEFVTGTVLYVDGGHAVI